MGVFRGFVHVPKVAWHSVVEPKGSKVGFVVVVVVVVDDICLTMRGVDDDDCSITRGVELVALRIIEVGLGG